MAPPPAPRRSPPSRSPCATAAEVLVDFSIFPESALAACRHADALLAATDGGESAAAVAHEGEGVAEATAAVLREAREQEQQEQEQEQKQE